MFPTRFFPDAFFAPRFWPKVGSGATPVPIFPGLATLADSGLEQATLSGTGLKQSTLAVTGLRQATMTHRTS